MRISRNLLREPRAGLEIHQAVMNHQGQEMMGSHYLAPPAGTRRGCRAVFLDLSESCSYEKRSPKQIHS